MNIDETYISAKSYSPLEVKMFVADAEQELERVLEVEDANALICFFLRQHMYLPMTYIDWVVDRKARVASQGLSLGSMPENYQMPYRILKSLGDEFYEMSSNPLLSSFSEEMQDGLLWDCARMIGQADGRNSGATYKTTPTSIPQICMLEIIRSLTLTEALNNYEIKETR